MQCIEGAYIGISIVIDIDRGNHSMSMNRGALLKPSEKGERRPTASRAIAKGSRYEILKDKIRTWCEDRFKVGEMLAEIQRDKLYKSEYATFEEMCEVEFDIKRAHAYRLIEAVAVKASVLSPIGDKVTNEGQARALAPVPVEQREEVLTKVAESGPVTAKAITQVAQVAARPSAKPEKVIHHDKTGYPIPDGIWEDWQRADAFSAELREISRIKGIVEKGLETGDLIFRELNSGAVAFLINLYGELKCVVPYAVCSSCSGRTRDKCALCKGRGYLSDFAWGQFVSPQVKEMRKKLNEKK